MPPPLLIDIDSLPLDRVLWTRDQIYEQLPQRYEFMMLDGLLYLDARNAVAVAFRDVRADEFWVRGHIPGRALFPGVLMLEAAAQTSAIAALKLTNFKGKFIGLGGVDKVKFRDAIVPGNRLHILVKLTELKSRRIISATQGWIDGKIVFEGQITGMVM